MKYENLKKLLKQKHIKLKDYATYLGITYTALSYKFSGKQEFSASQINKTRSLLNLKEKEVVKLFLND